jgi:DNA-binding IclR family transcriptional regulator
MALPADNEELELGVRCMAAGIYDDQSKLVAGLSISAPADRLDEGWLPKLQATARRDLDGAGLQKWGPSRLDRSRIPRQRR